MIPQNYLEWRHCIERQCGIPLTEAFIHQRLQALSDLADAHTRDFIRLYGEAHRQQIIAWLQQSVPAGLRQPSPVT